MPRTSTPATASEGAKGQSRASSAKAAGKDQAKEQRDGKAPPKAAKTKAAGGAKGVTEKPAPAAKPAAKERSSATRPASASKSQAAKAAAAKPAPAKAPAATRSPVPGRLARPQAPGGDAGASYNGDAEFLAQQRVALLEERETYVDQARQLRAEAESLVQEMEPGDVQFDEESGEGGTTTVDRERDLALSAQALAAVEEIDAALAKMDAGRYGVCEGCGQLILKARLEALPYARLCIACKSGGLSRR